MFVPGTTGVTAAPSSIEPFWDDKFVGAWPNEWEIIWVALLILVLVGGMIVDGVRAGQVLLDDFFGYVLTCQFSYVDQGNVLECPFCKTYLRNRSRYYVEGNVSRPLDGVVKFYEQFITGIIILKRAITLITSRFKYQKVYGPYLGALTSVFTQTPPHLRAKTYPPTSAPSAAIFFLVSRKA